MQVFYFLDVGAASSRDFFAAFSLDRGWKPLPHTMFLFLYCDAALLSISKINLFLIIPIAIILFRLRQYFISLAKYG